jgi:hypothetical protein
MNKPAICQGIFSGYRAEKRPGQFPRKSFFAHRVYGSRLRHPGHARMQSDRLTTPAAAQPPLGPRPFKHLCRGGQQGKVIQVKIATAE